jgi:DNA-binding transcriptional LysR family regulator
MTRIGDRGEMEAFVRSVELGGFSAAARELKLTPSALSKLVTRLERTLRVRLLNRSTRKLAPTAEGELFLARCRRILAEMEDAKTEVGRSRERPRGRLRMHVGVGFAMHQVVPALPRFFDRYPEVQIDLVIEDRNFDLVKEGIDISVRPGPPHDTSVVVRKIFDFQRIVCATPQYLARRGSPRTPAELAGHDCLANTTIRDHDKWPFDMPGGREVIKIAPAFGTNNTEAVLRLVLMGLGIARLNEFMAAEHIRRRRLVRVLPEYHCTEPLQMLALYPHERHRLPRVAAMLDFLTESFAERPWRAQPRKARPAG